MTNLKSVKIAKIEPCEPEVVYDITVPGDHNFFANKVLSHNCFVLVDEAQNLTKVGIKLVMTRISTGSKMVLNGDSQQIDLPKNKESGLQWAADRLVGKSNRISVAEMSRDDVQRHPIISTILDNLV
jgi:phosphate starvation-inducible PhoH-like protein